MTLDASEKLSKALGDLTRSAELIIDDAMRSHVYPARTVRINALRQQLTTLETACRPIVTMKAARQGRPSLVNACDRLWTIWEEITRRPFVRTWQDALGRKASAERAGSREFVNRDAQFVFTIMTALDPMIELAQARQALKQVAAARSETPDGINSKSELFLNSP